MIDFSKVLRSDVRGMMPVDTCGEKVYICQGCAELRGQTWAPSCANEAGRKGCWFCGSNLDDLDLTDPSRLSREEKGND